MPALCEETQGIYDVSIAINQSMGFGPDEVIKPSGKGILFIVQGLVQLF